MARKIELKTVVINNLEHNYVDWLKMILTHIPGNQGIGIDEMARRIRVLEPIEKAKREELKELTLDDEAWKLICDKLTIFPFAIVDIKIVEFGEYLRNLPEMGMGQIG